MEANWHPDPTGAHEHRWWNGTAWTTHVADQGVTAASPVPPGLAPPAPPAVPPRPADEPAAVPSAPAGPAVWTASGATAMADGAGPVWEQQPATDRSGGGASPWSLPAQATLFGRQLSPIVALGVLLVFVFLVWAVVSGMQETSEMDRMYEQRMERLEELRSRDG